MKLVFQYFYLDEKIVDASEILESINLCVAHLPDLIIDYPNAKQYARELIQEGQQLGIFINEETKEKYLRHIDNLEN
jgi:hypothetical protein